MNNEEEWFFFCWVRPRLNKKKFNGASSRRKGFQPDGYVISRRDGKFSLCGSPRKEKFLSLCPLCLRGSNLLLGLRAKPALAFLCEPNYLQYELRSKKITARLLGPASTFRIYGLSCGLNDQQRDVIFTLFSVSEPSQNIQKAIADSIRIPIGQIL